MMFGLSKEEMDELNRVVDEEIEREKKEAGEGTPSPDHAGDGESAEGAPASPDDDFMDILRKRSQGKNDEVE